jgi:hypothetical protein
MNTADAVERMNESIKRDEIREKKERVRVGMTALLKFTLAVEADMKEQKCPAAVQRLRLFARTLVSIACEALAEAEGAPHTPVPEQPPWPEGWSAEDLRDREALTAEEFRRLHRNEPYEPPTLPGCT